MMWKGLRFGTHENVFPITFICVKNEYMKKISSYFFHLDIIKGIIRGGESKFY